MVKHVILWTLKEELSIEEKEKIKADAKCALEALLGSIDGLLEIKLITCMIPSSNCDMMLDSTFEDREALLRYQKHPLHVAAADTFVRPYTDRRLCCDFET